MVYPVRLTSRAKRDLTAFYDCVNAGDSEHARQWHRGLKEAILRLGEMPYRHPQTPEDRRLRHLLYGRRPHVYRVIFRIKKKAGWVEVLHIRHGARRGFRASDSEHPD